MLKPITVTILALLLSNTLAYAEEGSAQDQLVQYIEMQPSFVVNFGGKVNKLRYLKADVSLRTDLRSAAAKVEHHLPALRNEMVLLLSKQPDEVMFDNSKHEEIRKEALTRIRDFLKEEEGAPLVEDLLFTNFVVQR